MAEIDALLKRMYGNASLPDPAGLLHVAAVWGAPGGRHVVMKIGPETPRSAHDFFALQLARARADAIVITGKILRTEPDLRYTLVGEHADALGAFRRRRGGRECPTLAVLSSGRALDLSHPALHTAVRPLVITGHDAPPTLEADGDHAGVPILRLERPSVSAAVETLRTRGHRSISLEAGPSTVVPLYARDGTIDELMLSIYEGPDLDTSLHAGEFPGRSRLDTYFGHEDLGRVVEEASGPWRFCRWRRGELSPGAGT